jgi:hypothetical protein
VAGSCGHGNESSGPIKVWDLFEFGSRVGWTNLQRNILLSAPNFLIIIYRAQIA